MRKVTAKRLAAAGGAFALAFAGILPVAVPASAAVEPVPSETAMEMDIEPMDVDATTSCYNTTPHIRRVIVGSAKVHSSYYGSAPVVATWKYRQLFRVDKRCVNSHGNLWWHSDCCTGVKGWIYSPYTEFANYNG
ncbi:hypothetical protein ACNAW0_27540 [Micromonospora sp. SL1-18]|uniref:hypothetical protein n=1 Tax=Micromonospora sp. SL1-18 TaxID=3399128 RepID=UPI003A4DA2AD